MVREIAYWGATGQFENKIQLEHTVDGMKPMAALILFY